MQNLCQTLIHEKYISKDKLKVEENNNKIEKSFLREKIDLIVLKIKISTFLLQLWKINEK